MFAEATAKLGYHPFPTPAAQMSRAYANPDGAKLGKCMYCGFCMNYGCDGGKKGIGRNKDFFALYTQRTQRNLQRGCTAVHGARVWYSNERGKFFFQMLSVCTQSQLT